MIWTLSLIVAYLGLFIGVIISSISPEELKTGMKYFYGTRKIIITITLFFITYYLFENINYIFSSIIAGIIALISLKIKFSEQLIFFSFPLFTIFFKNQSFWIFITSLFLFYGILLGSEETSKYVSKDKRKITKPKWEIIKKLTIKTNLFFISFIIVLIISFFI